MFYRVNLEQICPWQLDDRFLELIFGYWPTQGLNQLLISAGSTTKSLADLLGSLAIPSFFNNLSVTDTSVAVSQDIKERKFTPKSNPLDSASSSTASKTTKTGSQSNQSMTQGTTLEYAFFDSNPFQSYILLCPLPLFVCWKTKVVGLNPTLSNNRSLRMFAIVA